MTRWRSRVAMVMAGAAIWVSGFGLHGNPAEAGLHVLFAQSPAWPVERMPRPLPARDATFPPFDIRTLGNGMQVITVLHHEQPAVTITLGMGDQRVQGTRRGASEGGEPPEMLIGYATIHALDQLIGPRGQFRLENLQRRPFGAIEVCLSHLSLTTDDGVETLLGISVVRDGDLAAVARAVLDAVNRRLQRLLGGER